MPAGTAPLVPTCLSVPLPLWFWFVRFYDALQNVCLAKSVRFRFTSVKSQLLIFENCSSLFASNWRIQVTCRFVTKRNYWFLCRFVANYWFLFNEISKSDTHLLAISSRHCASFPTFHSVEIITEHGTFLISFRWDQWAQNLRAHWSLASFRADLQQTTQTLTFVFLSMPNVFFFFALFIGKMSCSFSCLVY